MYLKKQVFFIILSASLTACAPQRATFNSKNLQSSKKEAETSRRNGSPVDNGITRVEAPAQTTSGVTIVMSEAKAEALATLVSELDANSSSLGVGQFRNFKRRDPVTKNLETRSQIITAVNGNTAQYQTKTLETSEVVASGALPLDQFQPFRDGVRALSQRHYDEFYAMVESILASQGGGQTLPDASTPVEIEIAAANILPGPTKIFRFVLVIRIFEHKTDHDRGTPTLRSFEIRFAPSQPKPFDIAHIAYGAASPNRVVFSYIEFGKH